MEKPLEGSFVLPFVAPLAINQGRANIKEPPNSNYKSHFRSERTDIAVRTTTAVLHQVGILKT